MKTLRIVLLVLAALGVVLVAAAGMTASAQLDSDGDTVPDSSDNCPNDPNPLQENTDITSDPPGDTFGDTCDNCWFIENEAQTNTDADLEAGGASVVGDEYGDVCDLDDDNDGFSDYYETYLPTDTLDNCPDWPGTQLPTPLCPGLTCDGDDAWPLDNNVDKYVTVVGDVLQYKGNIGVLVGGNPILQRLDTDASGQITVIGDVLSFRDMISATCT